MTVRDHNAPSAARIAAAQEDPIARLLSQGKLLPRLPVDQLEPHLPNPQPLRIEINGVLCASPVAVLDAPAEFAIGWAFSHRFFTHPEELGRVFATDDRISLMVSSGVDIERTRNEVAGWEQRTAFDGERSDRFPRAVEIMARMDAIRMWQHAYQTFRSDHAMVGYAHAGIATASELVSYARDVSPHAAMHKTIGWAIRSGTPVDEAMLLVRGAVDDHIVESAARAGFPIVATNAYPTVPAIRFAEAHCITLAGLVTSQDRGLFADGGHFGDESVPFERDSATLDSPVLA